MEVVSYKCPNCTAPMKHDIDSQKWACDFCGTKVSPEEVSKLEAQIGNETVEEEFVNTPPEQYSEGDAVAYVCPSCGGHIVTTPVTAATFCVYCHNPAVIASHLKDEHRPNRIIPFKVKKEEAVQAMKRLCAKKPFLPRDFRRYAAEGEISGLYVPYWLFDLDVQGWLTAWGKIITTWSDSRYHYTKTDTYLVHRTGDTSFSKIPADGSERMDNALMDALEPFDYSQMVDFSMQYLSGHFAESYDVDADHSFTRADARAKDALKSMLSATVTGYNQVNISDYRAAHSNVSHENVMLPVWTLSVNYKGKNHIYAMNGQTGKMVGKLPLSIGRIFAWLGISGAALSALAAGVMLLLMWGGAI